MAVCFDLPGGPLKARSKGLVFLSPNSDLSLGEEVSTQEAFVKNVERLMGYLLSLRARDTVWGKQQTHQKAWGERLAVGSSGK